MVSPVSLCVECNTPGPPACHKLVLGSGWGERMRVSTEGARGWCWIEGRHNAC